MFKSLTVVADMYFASWEQYNALNIAANIKLAL